MQALEVRVLQALFYGVALLRVEHKHFTQKVQGHWVGLRVQRRPGLLVALRQLSDVLSCEVVPDEGHVLTRRGTEYSYGSLDLIEVVVSGEEGRTAQKLSENASNGPNIKSIRIVRSV